MLFEKLLQMFFLLCPQIINTENISAMGLVVKEKRSGG
jgi:hypothetical protein